MASFAYGAERRVSKAAAAMFFAGAAMTASPLLAEPLEIVALGDSLTAGYGLPDGEGFVPQLQAWLDANDVDATIVNAGVSGDTTAGGLARLDWAMSGDTDAVIVALGGNDLLRGLPPEASRANLDAILSTVAGERSLPVLLIGLEAPGNYGPAFKEDFDSMYPDLARDYGALHEVSFLGPLVAEVDMATARQLYVQPDGVHPNAEGVRLIVEAFGPRVAELAAMVPPG